MLPPFLASFSAMAELQMQFDARSLLPSQRALQEHLQLPQLIVDRRSRCAVRKSKK